MERSTEEHHGYREESGLLETIGYHAELYMERYRKPGFIKDYDELIWYPAEVDVSIRPSWGYVEGEEKQLYSLETLLYMYEKAVGRQCNASSEGTTK